MNYSWLQDQHLVRSSELIGAINQKLASNDGGCTCYLAPSTLAPDNDMLGMFVARDIQHGETILVDRTATGACSTPIANSCSNCFGNVTSAPVRMPCCLMMIYCSPECRDLALSTYYKPLCGQDFTWLQSPACGLTHNASPLQPLLMLRFITTAIQAGTHPLYHPLTARLQHLSNRNHLDIFTFTEYIKTPIRILQQLSIDPSPIQNSIS